MSENLFKETHTQFKKIQERLESHRSSEDIIPIAISLVYNEQIRKEAVEELKILRAFYKNKYYSAESDAMKEIILKNYQQLYESFNTLLSQENCAEDKVNRALDTIQANIEVWKKKLNYQNLMHIVKAVLWAAPLVAGVLVLPFALPILSLNVLLGVAIMTAAVSSIILSISNIEEHLSSLESSSSIKDEYLITELSLFKKFSSENHEISSYDQSLSAQNH